MLKAKCERCGVYFDYEYDITWSYEPPRWCKICESLIQTDMEEWEEQQC